MGPHSGNGKPCDGLQAIVFDFDGTLAELRLDFADMKRRLNLLAQHYLEAAPPLPALPVLEWLETLRLHVHRRSAAAAAEFQQRAELLIRDIEVEAAREGKLFPFTRPLLRDLEQHYRLRVAIITRNCEQAVRLVFPDMDDYCSGFLARDHVPCVKPDPDHLLRALEKISTPPESALMVGDHPLDIQTGRRAGTLTAGVWSGNASEADLLESGAQWTAQNCRELILVLQAQGWIRQRP